MHLDQVLISIYESNLQLIWSTKACIYHSEHLNWRLYIPFLELKSFYQNGTWEFFQNHVNDFAIKYFHILVVLDFVWIFELGCPFFS